MPNFRCIIIANFFNFCLLLFSTVTMILAMTEGNDRKFYNLEDNKSSSSAFSSSSTDCKTPQPLGMESGTIRDKQLSASSSFDPDSLGPQNGRIRTEQGGGAWCPRKQIDADSYEFIQVDLLAPFEIWAVEVQGRYGDGTGREFAEALMIDFIGEGQTNWTRYTTTILQQQQGGNDTLLQQQVFAANRDEKTAELIALVPPLQATSLRLVPFSSQLRTVCLRFELYGCPITNSDNLFASMENGKARTGELEEGKTEQQSNTIREWTNRHILARPAILYPLTAFLSILSLLLLVLLLFRVRLHLFQHRQHKNVNKCFFLSCSSANRSCSPTANNLHHPLRPSVSWQNMLLPPFAGGNQSQQSSAAQPALMRSNSNFPAEGLFSSARVFSPSFCRFDTVSLGWPSLGKTAATAGSRHQQKQTTATNWNWSSSNGLEGGDKLEGRQQIRKSKTICHESQPKPMVAPPLRRSNNVQQQKLAHSCSQPDRFVAITHHHDNQRQVVDVQQQKVMVRKPIPKPRSTLLIGP